MRVLHISTYDSGGAGLCCLRIHQSLLDIGIESKVLVLYKTSEKENVFSYGLYKSKMSKLPSKLFRFLGLKVTEYNKILELGKENHTSYSRPISPINLAKHELVKWADVIHLHWVNNFVDYPSFFPSVKKPIVWTLHDENLFYGIAHYEKGRLSTNKFELKYKQIKTDAVRKANNLNIVFLSKMFYEQFGKDEILNNCNKRIVINNSVDGNVFYPRNREEMRKKYNLDLNKKIILFMANVITNPIKGLDVLVEALRELAMTDSLVLAIGSNPQNQTWPFVKTIGLVNNEEILSELISAADYYAMPSYKEAFSQAPMEAMACGLPVVAFPVSGTSELINDTNGIVCQDFTKESLKEGLLCLIKNTYCSVTIRDNVLDNFSPKVIANKYADLYSQVLVK